MDHPCEMRVRNADGCSWLVTMRTVGDGHLALVEGWLKFAEVHGITLGCLVLFKLVEPKVLKVIPFGENYIEMVPTCGGNQPPELRAPK